MRSLLKAGVVFVFLLSLVSASAEDMAPVKKFVETYNLQMKLKLRNKARFKTQNDVFYMYPYVRIYDETFPELQLFILRERVLVDFRLCRTSDKFWVLSLGKIPYELIPRFLHANRVSYKNAILEIGIDGRKDLHTKVKLSFLMEGKRLILNMKKKLPGVKELAPMQLLVKPTLVTDILRVKRKYRRAVERLEDQERIENLKMKGFEKNGKRFEEKYDLPEDRKEPW